MKFSSFAFFEEVLKEANEWFVPLVCQDLNRLSIRKEDCFEQMLYELTYDEWEE